jgi:hypothetical protein
MTNTPQIEEHVRNTAVAIAGALGFTAAQMLGASRSRDLVEARHIAIWLAHRSIGASLSAIGRAMGLDHRSVQYAIDRISTKLSDDPGTRELVEGFASLIGQAPTHVRAEMDRLDRVRRGRQREHATSLLAVVKARQEAKAATARRRVEAIRATKMARARRAREAKREAEVAFFEGGQAKVRSRGYLIRQNDRFVAAMQRALAEEHA